MALGKKYLAGSPITNAAPEKPRQAEAIPLCQLEPSRAQILVAAETLLPPKKLEKVDKTFKRRPWEKAKPTARGRNGLSLRQVAGMLEDERIATAIDPGDAKLYKDLAAGNISITELCKQLGRDRIGLEIVLDEWERAIFFRYLEFHRNLPAGVVKSSRANRKPSKYAPSLEEELEDEVERDFDLYSAGQPAADGVEGGFRFGDNPKKFDKAPMREFGHQESPSGDEGPARDDYSEESSA
jgi:hypothetical protein